MKTRTAALAALALSLASPLSFAQTTVADAWVRGTVAQQKATGAFMKILSAQGGRLVAVSTPVAGIAEVHEMAMDGDVMKMRAVPVLALPAGQSVELRPGGYHVMLMDLKRTLKDGESVPLQLVFEGQDGRRETIDLAVPVKGPGAPVEHKH